MIDEKSVARLNEARGIEIAEWPPVDAEWAMRAMDALAPFGLGVFWRPEPPGGVARVIGHGNTRNHVGLGSGDFPFAVAEAMLAALDAGELGEGNTP